MHTDLHQCISRLHSGQAYSWKMLHTDMGFGVLLQVVPEYLARTIAGLLTDPLISACLPELEAGMRLLLQHLLPQSADLLRAVAEGARRSAQLDQVLQGTNEVESHVDAHQCRLQLCLAL